MPLSRLKPTRVKHLVDKSGDYAPLTRWQQKPLFEVSIPWGSETFVRRYYSDNEKKALARGIIELADEINLNRKIVFQRVNKEKAAKVVRV